MGRGLDGYFLIPVACWRCAVLKGRREARSRTVSGGYGEGETPLPIPNRAVKPLSADGTWPARARESRSPPVLHSRAALRGGSSSLSGVAGPNQRAQRVREAVGGALADPGDVAVGPDQHAGGRADGADGRELPRAVVLRLDLPDPIGPRPDCRGRRGSPRSRSTGRASCSRG